MKVTGYTSLLWQLWETENNFDLVNLHISLHNNPTEAVSSQPSPDYVHVFWFFASLSIAFTQVFSRSDL